MVSTTHEKGVFLLEPGSHEEASFILLVEDDGPTLRLERVILEEAGYEVRVVGSGHHIIPLLFQNQPFQAQDPWIVFHQQDASFLIKHTNFSRRISEKSLPLARGGKQPLILSGPSLSTLGKEDNQAFYIPLGKGGLRGIWISQV